MKVYLLKLTSGVEVIGRIDETQSSLSDAPEFRMSHPITFLYNEKENRLQPVPYSASGELSMTYSFLWSVVESFAEADDALTNNHTRLIEAFTKTKLNLV